MNVSYGNKILIEKNKFEKIRLLYYIKLILPLFYGSKNRRIRL